MRQTLNKIHQSICNSHTINRNHFWIILTLQIELLHTYILLYKSKTFLFVFLKDPAGAGAAIKSSSGSGGASKLTAPDSFSSATLILLKVYEKCTDGNFLKIRTFFAVRQGKFLSESKTLK